MSGNFLSFFATILLCFSLQAQNSFVLKNAEGKETGNDSIVLRTLEASLKFYNQGRPFEALEYCEAILPYLNEKTTTPVRAKALNYLGNFATAAEHYNKAVDYFSESIRMYRLLNQTINVATVQNNLGVVFEKLGKPHLSIKNQTEALKIFSELKDTFQMANAYTNLANNYIEIDEFNLAKSFYKKALKLDSLLNDSASISDDYNNIGYLYTRFNEFQIALLYFKKSLTIEQQLGNVYGTCIGHYNIGKANMDVLKNELALTHLLKAKQLAERSGSVSYLARSCSTLSEVYERLGNDKLSLQYFRKFEMIQDSADAMQKKALQFAKNQENTVKTNSSSVQELDSKNDGLFGSSSLYWKPTFYVITGICLLVLLLLLFRLWSSK